MVEKLGSPLACKDHIAWVPGKLVFPGVVLTFRGQQASAIGLEGANHFPLCLCLMDDFQSGHVVNSWI